VSLSTIGLCALKRATGYIGVTEEPPGSNRGPLIDAWNVEAGVPVSSEWCMSFAHAMLRACGKTVGGGASVGNFALWAQANSMIVARPRRGDLGCLEWEADNWPDHVVFVERVLALRWLGGRFVGWLQYVAGNDGNAVSRRRVWVNPRSRFARIV
jgi:hypothetical protein